MNSQVKKLTFTALMAAMITIFTAYICHIPVGQNGGYIHFGDSLIYIAACLLPWPYAMTAAAIGGGMADLLTAPVWAPATIIIKALISIPFTNKSDKIATARNVISTIIAFAISATGYAIAEAFITYGFTKQAFTGLIAIIPVSVPGSCIQSGGSAIIFVIYTYKNEVYANITNKCDCACTFCIRSQKDAIGDATTLWHKVDPTYDEIIAAIDAFDFTGYEEFVFCGYGEPTCALEMLEKTAKYVKEKYKLPIRVNTNGLGNLYHGRDIVPELAEYIDSVSISLNAANAEEYNKVTRPSFDNAYEAMLDFAEECNRMIKHTQLSIVDVLPEEDIKTCQQIADERGIHLKIRHFSN